MTASVASGCGPTRDAADVEFDDVCGAAWPLQLLALDEPDVVSASPHRVARARDRWVVGVHERGEIPSETRRKRVVAVDACGGEPEVLVDGYDAVLAPPEPHLAWFACSYVGWLEEAMVWIDPEGAAPAVSIGAEGCQLAWIGDDVVFSRLVSDGSSDLVAARLDLEGKVATENVLVENVRSWTHRTADVPSAPSRYFVENVHVAAEPTGRIYAVAADGVLFDIDVPARALTPIGQLSGTVRADGDLVVTRDSDLTMVLDRQRATTIELSDERSGVDSVPSFGPGAITVTRSSTADGNSRALTLGDMLVHSLPSSLLHPIGMLTDGRIAFSGSDRRGQGLLVWLPDNPVYRSERAELFAGPTLTTWQDGDLWAVVSREPAALDGSLDPEATFDLMRFDNPSLAATLVLEDVYEPLPLPGDRWATVRTTSGDVGSLVVLHAGQVEGELIDEDVQRGFAAFAGGPSRVVDEDESASTLIYMVSEGTDRGLWIAAVKNPG